MSKLNKKGQGLIEYLIIVAIVAVGAITVMGVVGGQINVKFAQVAKSLGARGGSDTVENKEVSTSATKTKNLENFFNEKQTSR